MHELTSRDRRILELRYLEGKKLDETGLVFGISRERVRQLEREAIIKLVKRELNIK